MAGTPRGDPPQLFAAAAPVRQLVESLPTGVLVLDRDLRIVEAEGEALRAGGHDPRSLPGRLLAEAFGPAVMQRLAPGLQAALSGVTEEFAYRSPLGGGSYTARVQPLRDETGEVAGAVAVFTDRSEVDGLRAQLEQARLLVPFGSAVYERRNGWVADAALAELWGRAIEGRPDELIGQAVLEEDRGRLLRAWTEFCAGGGRLEADFRMVRPDGQVRAVHLVGEGVADEQGLLSAVTTQVDTTAAMRAAETAARQDRAAEALRVTLLRQVGDLLTSGTASGPRLQAFVDLASAALGSSCAVWSTDSPGTPPRLRAAAGDLPGSGLQQLAAPEWAGVVARALAGGWATHGQHVLSDGSVVRHVVAPARAGGQAEGALVAVRGVAGQALPLEDVGLVQVLADRLGPFLAGERAAGRSASEAAARARLSSRLAEVSADQGALIVELDRTEGRERARLADLVHDGPLQLVVAAVLRLDLLQPHLASEQAAGLEAVAVSLQDAVEQLRTLMTTLSPSDPAAGLRPALQALAEATFVGTPVRVLVESPEALSLDPVRAESVHRIVREALVNARKHASASSVTVRVEEADGCVLLDVLDDGVGGATGKPAKGHLGLSSMRARAAAAGGVLQMLDRPGGGTQVRLRLPQERRARVRGGAVGSDASGGPGAADSAARGRGRG